LRRAFWRPVCGSLGTRRGREYSGAAPTSHRSRRKAAADGYTLLMGGNSSLVINPSLYETCHSIPSRTSRRSRKIHRGERARRSPSCGQHRGGLVALAKAEQGKLSMACREARRRSGRRIVQIHGACRNCTRAYRGTTALMPDLLANRISMSFAIS